MYLNSNYKADLNKTEISISAFKLYNLLFSGKITLQEYLKGLNRLKDNQKDS